jgi:hypothetical protein
MKQALLVFLCVFILNSCDTSSPKEIANAEIEEIFENLRSTFNLGDLVSILSYYHPDFLHNGDDFQDEETVWVLRLNQYSSLDFGNLDINLSNDFATVSFTLFLEDDEFSEPSAEKGDLSYFYSTYNGWMLCGNEFIEQLK